STGTPLATRSASTASGTVRGSRRACRSWARVAWDAPARSAAAPAVSSAGEAVDPSASRAWPRSAARRRTAVTLASPEARFVAGHGRRGVGQPTGAVHEEGVVITAGYERHHRGPKRLASGPSHRRTRRIPVVEVADELHVRGAGSDQDELKGARLALRGSGRGGGHPVEEEADRKGGSRYGAAERCEGARVRAPEPA